MAGPVWPGAGEPKPPFGAGAAALIRAGSQLLHLGLVVWGLTGWLVSDPLWLGAYLVFLPGLALVWRLNDGVCPLNNLETWVTTGRWRDTADPDHGGFLKGLVERFLRLSPSPSQMNRVTYSLMAAFWALGAAHLGFYLALPAAP